MATYEDVPIIPVNSRARSREMGWNIYDGKRASMIVPFLSVSKWVHIGGAGNIVFEQIDGSVGVVLNAEIGWHPITARRILVSGTPDDGGGVVNTTATQITYHGGT